ncbi:MAG: response regulator [Planctomycetes bacterium]|nr:response regulator [Planctomycetota bacterium]
MPTTATPSERAGAAPAEIPQRRPSRILIVEDNADILRATQRILAAHKYEVLTATDGEEALRAAAEALPDLVLLDIMIPKVDGLEVCRRLKADARTRGIMVIHVTGRGSVDNRVEGFNAGADDYIPKPFHIPELLARVHSSLRIKALTDDLAERNQQLLKSQNDLVQSEKMATIGLLAAGIAHEFNNIMAGVSGYAQLARKDPRFKDMLVDVALTQTERALELTRSLSTYNRPHPSGAVCDVAQTVENALRLVAKEVETAGVRVITELAETPKVTMSPGQLQEVVLNLVLNAIQAIDSSGGAIRVRVGPAEDADRFVLEVRDNGQGIPEEHLSRIFDPFFTTKGALGGGRQSGTGLGLTLCRNFVQSAGGTIEVASRVGQGSTFRVILPRAAEAATEPRRSAGTAAGLPPPAARRLRILVVDDEEHVREPLEAYLRDHDVVCCSTGEAALEACALEPFDYVILDVCMRKSMNGLQVFERLATLSPSPRVIFASGRFPDPAYREYLDRAHGHLLKPYKLEDLAALLGLAAGAGPGPRPLAEPAGGHENRAS